MTTPNALSPTAFIALGKAVALVYYSKRDFESFVTAAVGVAEVTDDLPFQTATKKEAAAALVSKLASNPERYARATARLVHAVSTFHDFSHLEQHGQHEAARQAVAAFKKLARPEAATSDPQTDTRAAELRHAERLEALRGRFFGELFLMPPQARGLAFEPFLTEPFTLFELDPKGSFAVTGEQIDGAFTYHGTDYLLEAKWEKEPVSRAALDAFSMKVSRKLGNTLGLALSVNGFSRDGIGLHNQHSPRIILMDGPDLIAVLEGRIRLDTLLYEKRRHAAHTGRIYRAAADILAGG